MAECGRWDIALFWNSSRCRRNDPSLTDEEIFTFQFKTWVSQVIRLAQKFVACWRAEIMTERMQRCNMMSFCQLNISERQFAVFDCSDYVLNNTCTLGTYFKSHLGGTEDIASSCIAREPRHVRDQQVHIYYSMNILLGSIERSHFLQIGFFLQFFLEYLLPFDLSHLNQCRVWLWCSGFFTIYRYVHYPLVILKFLWKS